MNIRRLHYVSGLVITIFVALHLFNHCYSIISAERHIEMMDVLRGVYRNVIVESVILFAVLVQIISGIKLFLSGRKTAISFFEKLHIWTGLYLAMFLVIHVSAVLVGRLVLGLDTNFYFGVAGINYFPTNLFFIPYYALAIISFFGHVAAIHNKKMQTNIAGFSPQTQSTAILAFGIVLTGVIFYGLTNHFQGIEIPVEYHVLIGK